VIAQTRPIRVLEIGCLTTLPTMVQTAAVRITIARIGRRSDTEHHRDVAAINLNALNQKADQISLNRPIDSRQSATGTVRLTG
jgi:hypothetical protein